MSLTNLTCIYHKGCIDGFGAAWVVKKACPGQMIEFIPARYGNDPPNVTDKNVIIVDFSYPRDVLRIMKQQAKSLLVLDHHKTAQANCEGLDFAVFDMEKSGCILAWEYFFPDEKTPRFLQYIQDRDLWRFELPDSKEINAAMFSYSFEFCFFDIWEAEGKLFSNLKNEGAALFRDRQKIIDSLVSGWAIERQNITGYDVPCLNCPRWLASETLHILAEDEPFAASYYDSADNRTFELRSAENGIDVSEIAKKFGGGGHKHAAGFTVEKPRIIL